MDPEFPFRGSPRRLYLIPFTLGLILVIFSILILIYPRILILLFIFLFALPIFLSGLALILVGLDLWRNFPSSVIRVARKIRIINTGDTDSRSDDTE